MKALLSVLCLLWAQEAGAQSLDLRTYQEPAGALTVTLGGDTVDPYFALRALLTAQRHGLDIAATAHAWIAWLLPRQKADGSFARYCRTPGSAWQACAPADADDVLAAMWPDLLSLAAPCRSLPPAWRASARRSLAHLAQLRDRQRGTFRISAAQPTSLLMDNIEIHASLQALETRCGAALGAIPSAAQLAVAIQRVFRPVASQAYLVSTQILPAPAFYPDQVAQVYPMLFGLRNGADASGAMQAWLAEHGDTWLARTADHYPWGMVALAASRTGATAPVLRWLDNAAPLRHGVHWNILEEAAFQSLCVRYRAIAVPCQGEQLP